jgi:hypothetical protein
MGQGREPVVCSCSGAYNFPDVTWAGHERYEKWICCKRLHQGVQSMLDMALRIA